VTLSRRSTCGRIAPPACSANTSALGYLQPSRLTPIGLPTLLLWNDWISAGVRAAETLGLPVRATARTALAKMIGSDEIHNSRSADARAIARVVVEIVPWERLVEASAD
jgi:hypothetical protein